MRQETVGFCDAVASAEPYVHITPDRWSHLHLITQFLQAGRSSWRPTNSVKQASEKFHNDEQPIHYSHTQLYNGPLSGTNRFSWYKKKHSPTHTHEKEEEGFVQITTSALSQRGLLDPNKPHL